MRARDRVVLLLLLVWVDRFLDNNKLSGPIPVELGRMTALKKLYVRPFKFCEVIVMCAWFF